MIITNHNLLHHLDCHHFSRFNCDVKAYAVNTDTEKSNDSEEEQTYYMIGNDNSSKESESEKNNSAINFTLSESFQCTHECQQCHKKYLFKIHCLLIYRHKR